MEVLEELLGLVPLRSLLNRSRSESICFRVSHLLIMSSPAPGDDRERDVIPRLPAPPRPRLRGNASPGEKRIWEAEMEVWRRLGKVLLALKQLWRGKLVERELRGFEEEYRKSLPDGSEGSVYFPISWDQSSTAIRRAVKELERAVRRYLRGPPKLCGKAALARLVSSSTSPYEAELGEGGARPYR